MMTHEELSSSAMCCLSKLVCPEHPYTAPVAIQNHSLGLGEWGGGGKEGDITCTHGRN